MRKLISMVEFVLEQFNKWKEDNNPDCQSSGRYILGTSNYANFLKQPLAIWQFVPCKLVDGVWVVLEEPKPEAFLGSEMIAYKAHRKKCDEFQEAKSRCIFEGWVLENTSKFTIWIEKEGLSICFTDRGKINVNSHNEKTIEDIVKHNLELTASAIKELVLQE